METMICLMGATNSHGLYDTTLFPAEAGEHK